MLIKKFKDGVVQLYLNGELKLEQADVASISIGSYYDSEGEKKCDYNVAYVGKDASLTGYVDYEASWDAPSKLVEVYVDGVVEVDEGGRIAGINLTGGTYSGAGLCEGATGSYGAGICLSGTDSSGNWNYYYAGADPVSDERGAIYLSGATFSACVVDTTGYSALGGAVETWGGTLSAQSSLFVGNSAKSSGSAGGAMALMFSSNTITGSTFSENKAYFGGAIQQRNGTMEVSGSLFLDNETEGDPTDAYAPGGGAIELHEGATATITGSTFSGNKAYFGGAIYNDTYDGWASTVDISGCTFSGNSAEKDGGAIWNGGIMTLENVVLTTESDTVFNGGALTFAGANTLGAAVINDGSVVFDIAAGTDALLSDLGQFSGTGSYLVSLSSDAASAGAAFAASAGTFTGSLSVKLDDAASSDAFTLNEGAVGNDLAIAGAAVLRLTEDAEGALAVQQEVLETLVPAVSNDGSVLTWTDGEYAGGFWVEIAQGDSFDGAIRVATNGTAFDVAGRAGTYSCRAAEANGSFTAGAASWSSSGSTPRQIVSNGNDRADIFFASVNVGDVWSSAYQALNTVTGETCGITGKNRIRDTFSGSESDANILYLSDTDNGDALFMDDIYSNFGADAARLSRIREVRAGAGADIVDMTSENFTAELAGMTVRGGDGDDVLWGASGGNKLFGDAGNDWITGGTGDDWIAGGAGDDVLAGGGGNDTFVFGENWGNDYVSQEGGTVELWFLEAESQISASDTADGALFSNADGTSSVTVKDMTVADLEGHIHYGNDDALAAVGAFLGSSSELIFETEIARTQGILASL